MEYPTTSPQDLTRAISLSINDSADALLSTPRTINTEEELSIPREVIADAVHSTRFYAELQRPIRIGSYGIKNQPAWLLCFHYAFQRLSDGWLTRVRAATIEIECSDAPLDTSKAGNPSVADFYPKLYEGPASHGQVVRTMDASLSVAPPSGGPSLGTGYTHEVTAPLESKLYIHGISSGRGSKNKVTWTIREDRLKNDGVPREMRMPIIVTSKEPRRFSARVTVSAHYAMVRGQLAKMIPVIGKMDDPLFFDPVAIKIAADEGQTGPDGKLIAHDVENLNGLSLVEFSSFQTSSN